MSSTLLPIARPPPISRQPLIRTPFNLSLTILDSVSNHIPTSDWADDDDNEEVINTTLPPDETIQNRDGTKTVISYHLNDRGQTVKTTRRIRLITHREVVNPRVAQRKQWAKFGLSANDGAGPASDTTSVGENIIFRPSANWKQDAQKEENDPNAQSMKDKLRGSKVKCRICSGEHFTARCPYKDTMAPVGGEADVAAGMGDEPSAGGASRVGEGDGGKKGSYVPPALRKGAGGGEGEKMGGKYSDRDDLATLRVTNVRVFPSNPFFPPFFSFPQFSFPSVFIFIFQSWETLLLRLVLACVCVWGGTRLGLTYSNLPHACRSPRWPRSRSSATCLNASAASPACSSPRTGRRAAPRASLSSALPTVPTLSRPVPRWTDTVSST